MSIPEYQKKAVAKYVKNNYDDIKIRVEKGMRGKIKNFAESKGLSLNGYVTKLIKDDMQKNSGEHQ